MHLWHVLPVCGLYTPPCKIHTVLYIYPGSGVDGSVTQGLAWLETAPAKATTKFIVTDRTEKCQLELNSWLQQGPNSLSYICITYLHPCLGAALRVEAIDHTRSVRVALARGRVLDLQAP